MIKCTVCQAENDDFATTCVQCKAFLQDRVPHLNLFETSWQVIESPGNAFRKIVLAEHKNYVLFLFAVLGVATAFTTFWYFRLGLKFTSLMELIPYAVGGGVVVGLAAAVILTGVYHGIARILGGTTGFRNSFGVFGYALTPVAFSLFLILPIELSTFGMYLFTGNPHPYTIKPLPYVVLIGFDGLIAIWTFALAVVATKVAHRIGVLKSLLTVAATVALFVGGIFYVALQIGLVENMGR